ncbi:MAG: ArnT family glycosyltransferase [Gammaproteobacteria bacterium]
MPEPGSSAHNSAFRVIALALLVATTAGLIVNHLYLLEAGGDPKGLSLLLDHLFVIALTLSLVILCASLGRYVLKHLEICFAGSIEEFVFSVGTGLGLVGIPILLMGLAGVLHEIALGAFFTSLLFLARREIREIVSLAGRTLELLWLERAGPPLGLFGLAALAVAVFLLAILSVAPPTDWDSLMYHITIPSEFLSEDRIYVPEDNLHVSRLGLVHMLYLPLLVAGGTAAPAVLSACLALVLALALFAFSQRYLHRSTSSLVLAGVWGTTSIILVAITPRVDVTLTLFLFLAHYALVISLLSRGRGHLYLAAAYLGFAFGVKFHAVPYAFGLLPLVILAAHDRADGIRGAIRPLLGFFLVGLVFALPWLAKNWILLHAPLYPFFSPRLLEQWLVPLYGGLIVPPSIDPNIFDWVWDLRRSFNLRDLIMAPGNLTIEAEGNLYFFNPLLLAVPLWIFSRHNRAVNWLLLPAALFLVGVLVPFPRTNLRYLIPALVPLTLVACHVLASLSHRFLSAGPTRILLAFLGGISLLPSVAGLYLWLNLTGATPHFYGQTSRKEYLDNHTWFGDLMDVTVWANSRLPGSARILLLFEARGYYFEKQVLQDNLGSNLPLIMEAWNGEGCLEGSSITHVLLNTGALEYFLEGGLDPKIIQWDRFERFRARCLHRVYRNAYFELYHLRVGTHVYGVLTQESTDRRPSRGASFSRDKRSTLRHIQRVALPGPPDTIPAVPRSALSVRELDPIRLASRRDSAHHSGRAAGAASPADRAASSLNSPYYRRGHMDPPQTHAPIFARCIGTVEGRDCPLGLHLAVLPSEERHSTSQKNSTPGNRAMGKRRQS